MSQVTVEQLAQVVGTPVDKLLEQLQEAGLQFNSASETIDDSQKMQLLEHLRQSRASKSAAGSPTSGKRITLKRKSTSQLKVTGGQGRTATTKTVNVEVRRKKTYVKRADLIDEEEQRQEKKGGEKAS